jgi:hypothetical protein
MDSGANGVIVSLAGIGADSKGDRPDAPMDDVPAAPPAGPSLPPPPLRVSQPGALKLKI